MEDNEVLLNSRYKLLKQIGSGAYGVVHMGEDTLNNNELVAIKRISKARLNESEYLTQSLRREISIMKSVISENCVKFIEYFETEEDHNVVMELCNGDLDGMLKERIKKTGSGFTEKEVKLIFLQLNNVLRILREQHIMHRDLKLKNILIKSDETVPILGYKVKLSDFGFSSVCLDDIASTNLGTPSTKAPEILFDEGGYSEKVDLWSVGVMMFQLIFNNLPFPGRNVMELKMAIKNNSTFIVPKNAKVTLSDGLRDLLDKLLQKKASQRINFEEYFAHPFFNIEKNKSLDESISSEDEKSNDDMKLNKILEISDSKLDIILDYVEDVLKLNSLNISNDGLKIFSILIMMEIEGIHKFMSHETGNKKKRKKHRKISNNKEREISLLNCIMDTNNDKTFYPDYIKESINNKMNKELSRKISEKKDILKSKIMKIYNVTEEECEIEKIINFSDINILQALEKLFLSTFENAATNYAAKNFAKANTEFLFSRTVLEYIIFLYLIYTYINNADRSSENFEEFKNTSKAFQYMKIQLNVAKNKQADIHITGTIKCELVDMYEEINSQILDKLKEDKYDMMVQFHPKLQTLLENCEKNL